eukprot:g10437.t1
MGDAEVSGALPTQVVVVSEGGVGEEISSREDQIADASIEDEALVGGSQLDNEMPDAADNEDIDGIEVTKTDGEGAEKQHHGDKANGGGTKAEIGVEVADGNAENDTMYRRVRELALEAINAAREAKQLGLLSLDEALVVPAMIHCRVMCEHDFLSHWDIAGRKPYHRYSDFAYGQHITEVVFGFDVNERTGNEIFSRIKECIDRRVEADMVGGGGSQANHVLDNTHTHIGIGVYVFDNRLRYVEVYADRYLELLDSPAALSVANKAPGFTISVQMTSPELGPYACLIFHDPVATPLTVGELQQQFNGPYSDFTSAQVGIVWPWQMDLLDDGVVSIHVPVSPVEAGSYYIQILVRGYPESIPYDTNPAGGIPVPGESFCGGALVLRALEENQGDIGISNLGGAGGLLSDNGGGTLEEREARAMASTTALRRDLAPIVRVRVVQAAGGNTEQESYESKVFMSPERDEDMAQLNFGVEFLRLGAWDDFSSRERSSDGTGSVVYPGVVAEARQPTMGEAEEMNTSETTTETPEQMEPTGDHNTPAEAPAATDAQVAEAAGSAAQNEEAGETNSTPAEGESSHGDDADGAGERNWHKGDAPKSSEAERGFPLVATDITLVTCGAGEKVQPPEGFELIPGDLANPSALNGEGGEGGEGGPEEMLGEQPTGQMSEGEMAEEQSTEDKGQEEAGISDRDMVFICVKMERYSDAVSPLTDLAVVYGTEGFQMGFGFATIAMPQIVNELYGRTVHLCYKKAGASLAVIQQIAEKTAETTAEQIQQHLGIEREGEESRHESIEGKAYDVDTNMTPEQMLEWEEQRNREAAERAEKREQAERDHRRKEASDAVRRHITEALKEKEELVKQNGEWQKKIASLMLTQQKTREEARTEHGGRGVEREATPLHESEKHYAESLASIVSCRERLHEQQAEYDTVAIALQTRLDEKEYKSREIAESFREFKREIARTAEHSRTGKAIPKGVISQFEAAEAKKDREIEKVRLKNINLRMMLKKVEGNLRAKEQLAEGLHLIDFEQLKIENQTVNEKIEERNEELLKLRKKNTTTVQILTHTKEKLQFVAAENSVTSHQLSSLEEDVNQERDCLTRAKKERDNLRREVTSLRQSQGFANSDLLILDYERRKSHLKKLGQKLEEMRSKHDRLLVEQERYEERTQEVGMVQL